MADREMTLEEWVDRLPSFHRAHREYDELRARMTALEHELAKARCMSESWFDDALDTLIQKAAHSMPPHDFVFHVSSHISDARVDIAMKREVGRLEGGDD